MNGYIEANIDSEIFIREYKYETLNKCDKLTSIIILTYNQLNYTKLCIESIRKFTQMESYEIIIVDNNSTDGSVKWLENQDDLKVIYNKENKGFPAGCNQGIKMSKGDNIVLLNNDTIVTPNWLNNLEKALYSSTDVGAVGSVSNSCSNGQQIVVGYGDINQLINFTLEFNKSNSSEWEYRIKLIGYCYMVKKEVLDKVGLLDEIFTPGNYEDDDISLRIISEGYKLILCKDTFIHHFGSVSFANEGAKFSEVFFKNKIKIEEKWGFDTNYNEGIKLEMINLIDSDLSKEINVLDIGCGIGASLLEVKNKYKNANLYGIDRSEAVAKVAKGICNVLVGNIENLELPYENKFFDYIMLPNNLEHIIDTEELMRRMKKYLKVDGYILASIPNIMHVNVIRTLLNGRFKYETFGILNESHLRFFTLREIQELYEVSDYELVGLAATILQPAASEETLIDSLCELGIEGLRQQYTISQYIVKAKNKLDIAKYESEDMINLKFKLMRLDNNIDIDKSLECIFDIYNKYKDEFIDDVNYLIKNHIINKEKVKSIIAAEGAKIDIKILMGMSL